ncbi:MAG: GAF domain-containing protein [Actinomycetota bacterium]
MLHRPGPADGTPGQAWPSDSGVMTADSDAMTAVREAMARSDVLSSAARLVLRSTTASEAALLRRCARLLARELAAWVIVDAERSFRLRRQYVAGPRGERSAGLAKLLAAVDPAPGSVPSQVHDSGSSFLVAHAEDTGLLGSDASGRLLLSRLGAASVLTVPLTDGDCCYGTLTLVRAAREEYFGLADAGLAEQIGECIALGIRALRAGRRGTGAECAPGQLPPADGSATQKGTRCRPGHHGHREYPGDHRWDHGCW